jgi:adenylate cyclase
VKLIGDGAIVEFGSVVVAVECALSVQRSGVALPDATARPPTIVLRIGINLGDVIFENDDLYGDGVNIAARMEPLAEPGGICVSSIVNESVGNRVDVRFTDGGDISVKNVDRPIRVWKWHPGKMDVAPNRSNTANAEPQVETRSIAVLRQARAPCGKKLLTPRARHAEHLHPQPASKLMKPVRFPPGWRRSGAPAC